MPFHVRDPETDRLVRDYAAKHRLGITEAIKRAVIRDNQREDAEVQRRLNGLAALQKRWAALSRTGLEADKAFYDSLNDE